MTCSNYGELAISVSRAANSALSSHHEFVIICYSLCNNVCEGIENISSLKKKKVPAEGTSTGDRNETNKM